MCRTPACPASQPLLPSPLLPTLASPPARKIHAQIAKESLTYAGAPLTLEPKAEYVKRREAERAAKAAAQAAAPPPAAGAKRSREEGEEPAAEPPTYTPGCCVAFDFGEGAEFKAAPTFHLIKDTFGGRDAGLQYADYEAVRQGGGGLGLGN